MEIEVYGSHQQEDKKETGSENQKEKVEDKGKEKEVKQGTHTRVHTCTNGTALQQSSR